MKVFVILSCIALAVAKPQGYSYNQPSSGGFSGSHAIGSPSGLNQPLPSTSAAAPIAQAPIAQAPLPQALPSFDLNAPAAAPAPSFNGHAEHAAQQSFAQPQQQQQSFAQPQQQQQSFASQQQLFDQPAQSQALVQKHIYVHVPPREIEEEEELSQHNALPAQKHINYKIIFIKAPSQSINKQQLQQLAQPQQTEEKTLVYVLSKKDDSFAELAHQLQQQQQLPIQPTKPEVYFIKYRTQKGGAHQEAQFAPSAPAQGPATASHESDAITTDAATFNGQSHAAQSHAAQTGSAEASLPIPAAPQQQAFAQQQQSFAPQQQSFAPQQQSFAPQQQNRGYIPPAH